MKESITKLQSALKEKQQYMDHAKQTWEVHIVNLWNTQSQPLQTSS